ncbi:MAG TPA: hypothetical protein VNJ07_06440, partial [Chitinophagales bacterium]|nr:hypothetical protein [Chitinophagales bacterium]
MKKNRPLCMELLLAGMLISLLALTPDFTLAQCPDATIRIEIFTDNYPEETTWQLFDQSTGLVIASDDLSIAGLPFTLYSWDVCVTSTGCYDFTINDAFGDGICCAEGSGYYNVYFNGALVTTGGAFFFSETTTDIGGCSSQGCPESTVALQIFTDNYPEETSWQLVDRSSGFIIAQDNLTGQPDQTLVTYEICVAANGCYTFTIFDSFGDGICCSFGNGYYNLYLDGILQATGGSFGTSDLASIGNCAPSGSCTTCQGPPPANDA